MKPTTGILLTITYKNHRYRPMLQPFVCKGSDLEWSWRACSIEVLTRFDGQIMAAGHTRNLRATPAIP